jgi:hypothetical protein
MLPAAKLEDVSNKEKLHVMRELLEHERKTIKPKIKSGEVMASAAFAKLEIIKAIINDYE